MNYKEALPIIIFCASIMGVLLIDAISLSTQKGLKGLLGFYRSLSLALWLNSMMLLLGYVIANFSPWLLAFSVALLLAAVYPFIRVIQLCREDTDLQ